MLYLNGTDGLQRKPKPFNEHLNKVGEVYGTFGYVLHAGFYDTCLYWLRSQDYPADKVYSMFIQFHKVYKVKAPLVFHRRGLSEIQGIVPRNYKHLERGRR
jgi:hypothetical protein